MKYKGLPQMTGAHGRRLQPALRYHAMPLGLGDDSGSATAADVHRLRPAMHHQCGARGRGENVQRIGVDHGRTSWKDSVRNWRSEWNWISAWSRIRGSRHEGDAR